MNFSEFLVERKRQKPHKPPRQDRVAVSVYFIGPDVELYYALAKKYPSKKEGIPNVSAFIRAHRDEILSE